MNEETAKPQGRVTWPTHPGSRPKKTTRAQLIKRIVHGHDGVARIRWDEAGILEQRQRMLMTRWTGREA